MFQGERELLNNYDFVDVDLQAMVSPSHSDALYRLDWAQQMGCLDIPVAAAAAEVLSEMPEGSLT